MALICTTVLARGYLSGKFDVIVIGLIAFAVLVGLGALIVSVG